jgi:NAD(P)-dependent dehydrogenase (short-subunit alcohol dehydrogenase family)
MRARPVWRPVTEQVVVLVGASSGVGRETAVRLGQRGARVVVAARNQTALDAVAAEVERAGGTVLAVPTDVADFDQVQQLATRTVERFGRIDTWVNLAAVSVYATVADLDVAEIARVITVNLLGQIHGIKAVLPQLERQGHGGIINVSSVLGERAVPLQAAYSAAKHGLKGFTDALRLELAHAGSPVTVTLLLPSSINTPLFDHARSKLGVKPQPIPPIYEPGVVADSILFAAEHPRPELVVGGAGKLLAVGDRLAPALVDRYLLGPGRIVDRQRTDQPPSRADNLQAPSPGVGAASGSFGQRSKSTSPYTLWLEHHPQRRRRLLAVGAAVGLLAARRGWAR